MKVKINLIGLILLFCTNLFGQQTTFQHIYYFPNGMIGYSLKERVGVGYYVLGSQANLSLDKIRIVQLNDLKIKSLGEKREKCKGKKVMQEIKNGEGLFSIFLNKKNRITSIASLVNCESLKILFRSYNSYYNH